MLPMIGIPTTAGTGSDAQSDAVLADAAHAPEDGLRRSRAAFTMALLDPAPTVEAAQGRHVGPA